MSTPAVAALAVGLLLVGVVLGWLWRGATCRRRHAHLASAYEPAGLGTFFGEHPVEPLAEPAPDPVTPGEFPGSAKPLPDGGAPTPAYEVKAKRSSRIYHRPGTSAYARTSADVWFRTAEEAEAAGFRAPKQRSAAAPRSPA